ncbi:MAG: hypothetical protein RRA35_07310 [Desulfomonilia bacterium]|nr:hypothetical protein [Desulfomonilia bacterium]
MKDLTRMVDGRKSLTSKKEVKKAAGRPKKTAKPADQTAAAPKKKDVTQKEKPARKRGRKKVEKS